MNDDHPWDFDYLSGIGPGSRIGIMRGGEVWTQAVDNVTYSTQPYVAAPALSRLQRIMRRLTPRRWRRPLPQPTGGLPVVTIKTTDPFWSRATSNLSIRREQHE